MSHFVTLRARLTLIYSGLLLLAFLGLGLLLHGIFSRDLHRDLEREIGGDAEGAAVWTKSEVHECQVFGRDPDDDPPADYGKNSGHGGLSAGVPSILNWRRERHQIEVMDFVVRDVFLKIIQPNGRNLQSSKEIDRYSVPKGLSVDPSNPAYFGVRDGALGELRFCVLPVATDWGTFTILTAKPEASVRHSVATLDHAFLVSVPLILLVAASGGYIIAGRALRPIGDIARTAEAIRSGDLSRRIHLEGPRDELGQLADTLDSMIGSIEQLMTTQQRFFADASHELRTPLTVILSALEVSLRDPKPDVSGLREAMGVAQEEARHMKGLVNDLMTLARADAGQGPLRLQPVALEDLIQDACESARWMMGPRELHLELDDPVTLDVDPDRLRRLLMNLLTNAVQHTAETGHIAVRLKQNDDFAEIQVQDDGPGIPEEHLEQIFERFYRVDEARGRNLGGTGLGLAICKWIAEAHGGFIRAGNANGAEFTVSLPKRV